MNSRERASLQFQAPYSRELATFVVCPHCKNELTSALVTCDGHLFAAYRCNHHGDVVPMRSHVCNGVAHG